MIMVELEELLKTLKTLQQTKEFTQFFELLERAIEIAKEMESEHYLIELNIEKSNAYFNLGNFEFALSTLLDYKSIIQMSNNRPHLMRLYSGLAAIHGSLQEYEEFYLYLNKTKDIAEELVDIDVLVMVHHNFVVYYDRKKQYERALKHAQICQDYLEQDANYRDKEMFYHLQRHLAQVHIHLDNLKEAEVILQQLFEVIEGKEPFYYSELLITQARWYIAMNYYEKAYETFQLVKAQALVRQDYNLLQDVNCHLVEVVNLLGDTQKIIEANDAYIESIQLAQQYNYNLKIKQVELLLTKNKFKDQVYLDPLTTIHNRRYFEKTSEQWLADEQNPEQYYLFFIFDADHFKQVNDRHGHLVGDDVIKKLAHTGQKTLATNTVIFSRFGGDEFVGFIKLPDVAQMETIIRALHEALTAIQYEVDGDWFSITVSIGATAMQFKRFSSVEQLMKQADDALYMSKRNGRNQYTLIIDEQINHAKGTLPM